MVKIRNNFIAYKKDIYATTLSPLTDASVKYFASGTKHPKTATAFYGDGTLPMVSQNE